jgi:hypothetical protein
MKPCLLALLILASCTAIPTSTRLPALQNDCLPQAAAMVQGLARYDIPAEVLIMRPTEGMGHALAVYSYKGKVWAWDRYWGSVESQADFSDAFSLGEDWWYRWGRRSGFTGIFDSAFFLNQ